MFGIPRWRGGCDSQAGKRFEVKRKASAAVRNCGAFFIVKARRSRRASSKCEPQVASLGSVPFVVIAPIPHWLAESWMEETTEANATQNMQVSKNAELVIATGSGAGIPPAGADVIIAAV